MSRRDYVIRMLLLVLSAFAVLATVAAAVIHADTITDTGIAAVAICIVLCVAVFIAAARFKEGRRWIRFGVLPMTTVATAALLLGGVFGPLTARGLYSEPVEMKSPEVYQAEMEAAQSHYTGYVLLNPIVPSPTSSNRCITASRKLPTGISITNERDMCAVRIDWGPNHVLAFLRKDNQNMLHLLETDSTQDASSLTLIMRVPVEVRLELFVYNGSETAKAQPLPDWTKMAEGRYIASAAHGQPLP